MVIYYMEAVAAKFYLRNEVRPMTTYEILMLLLTLSLVFVNARKEK